MPLARFVQGQGEGAPAKCRNSLIKSGPPGGHNDVPDDNGESCSSFSAIEDAIAQAPNDGHGRGIRARTHARSDDEPLWGWPTSSISGASKKRSIAPTPSTSMSGAEEGATYPAEYW